MCATKKKKILPYITIFYLELSSEQDTPVIWDQRSVYGLVVRILLCILNTCSNGTENNDKHTCSNGTEYNDKDTCNNCTENSEINIILRTRVHLPILLTLENQRTL